jgi:hypothetical protein
MMPGRRAHRLFAHTMPPLQVELVSCYAGEETLLFVGWLRRWLQRLT